MSERLMRDMEVEINRLRARNAKLEADLEYRTSQRDNLYGRIEELDRALTALRTIADSIDRRKSFHPEDSGQIWDPKYGAPPR